MAGGGGSQNGEKGMGTTEGDSSFKLPYLMPYPIGTLLYFPAEGTCSEKGDCSSSWPLPSHARVGVLSGHPRVLCRVCAPFSCDTCEHLFSYLLKRNLVLSPNHKGDTVPYDLCSSGDVGAMVPWGGG